LSARPDSPQSLFGRTHRNFQNVCKSWRKLIANLPDCDLKFEAAAAITRQLKDWGQDWRRAFSEDFQKPKAILISGQQDDRSVNTSASQPSLWRVWACERDDLLFDPRQRGDEEGAPPCRQAIVSPNGTTITKPKPATVRERVFASEKVR
jgi:hypothetical protein